MTNPPRHFFWPVVLLAIGFTAAAGAAYLWLRPARPSNSATVVSGSMMPALRGPHYAITCDDCRWEFACSGEQLPEGAPIVCPLCGHRQLPPNPPPDPGDQVIIDRRAFDIFEPRRWQVVAFEKHVERWEVKRLVGLPGEMIGVHHGDIFVDSRPVQKSLEEAIRMGLTVHDTDYPTVINSDIPQRWRRSEDGSSTDSTNAVELVYEHWRCIETPLPRTEPAPVMDSYGANQALSRELNAVRDLIVQCEAALGAAANIELTLKTLGHKVQARVNAASGEAQLLIDGEVKANQQIPSAGDRVTVFRLGVLDGRAIFAVDSHPEIAAAITEPLEWEPSTHPAVVKLTGGIEEQIRRLVIYRDLYYLHPNQTAQRWSVDLGEDEYLVLGDNAPVSADGRHFGAIRRDAILGAVWRAD